MRLPHQNCVYTGGLRNRVNQNVYAEYTEESTEDDPIVRISGEADGGPFDFTCFCILLATLSKSSVPPGFAQLCLSNPRKVSMFINNLIGLLTC